MKAGNIGYLLWGSVGTGKSYLAGCIANALMEKEISVRMTNFALILNDLAATFEGKNEYISNLCRYPLLKPSGFQFIQRTLDRHGVAGQDCSNGCDREADKQDSVFVLLPFG